FQVTVSMGIKGLTKLLRSIAPSAVKECKIENFFGYKVAIDASMSIYQFLVAVRSGNDNLQMDGETTSHLTGMFYRSIKLMEKGIKPIFVFDGKPPDIKENELIKRKVLKEKVTEDLKIAQEEGDMETAIKLSRRLVHIKPEYVDECRKLFSLLGVPYIDAPGEAEAECVNLVKLGFAYAVGTEDMDALTFGANVLLRHLSPSNEAAKKQPVLKFTLKDILNDTKMSKDQFIDLCILLGCDYCASIKGIGPKKAIHLITKYKNIEEIIKNIDKNKYLIPEDWNYVEARFMFKNPLVSDKENIKVNSNYLIIKIFYSKNMRTTSLGICKSGF
ncbi:hypothetical protein A3Q56_01146, partial [Intoshia linei]